LRLATRKRLKLVVAFTTGQARHRPPWREGCAQSKG
jgi:hypothetical protein